MARRILALALLAPCLLTSPLPAQGVEDVLDTLQQAWPYSVPRGIATTPQGDWLYIGEGGSLAYSAQADASTGDTFTSSNFSYAVTFDDCQADVPATSGENLRPPQPSVPQRRTRWRQSWWRAVPQAAPWTALSTMRRVCSPSLLRPAGRRAAEWLP